MYREMSQDSDWDEPTWTTIDLQCETFLPNSLFLARSVKHYIQTNQPEALARCLSELSIVQLNFFLEEHQEYFNDARVEDKVEETEKVEEESEEDSDDE